MIFHLTGLGGPVITASNGEVFAQLWNPSGTKRIRAVLVHLFMHDFDIAGNSFFITRTTTRGTPGSTVTPDADNADEGDAAPPSGMLLDLAEFSVQPTLAVPELNSPFTFPAGAAGTEGSGFSREFPRGIVVPPGTGLAVCEKIGNTFSGTWDAGFVVDD